MKTVDVPKCSKHNVADYGFDLFDQGEPQIRHVCLRCGNTGLDLAATGLERLDLADAVMRVVNSEN